MTYGIIRMHTLVNILGEGINTSVSWL